LKVTGSAALAGGTPVTTAAQSQTSGQSRIATLAGLHITFTTDILGQVSDTDSARMNKGDFRLRALAIFALALALRLVHVWQLRRSPFFDVLLGDARGYDEWAQRIAGGDWIGTDVFYQAPLYPYFLATLYSLFGHSLLIVRIVQACVGAGSAVALAFAGRQWFSERIGTIAGVALAIYAPAIFFDGLLQKSVLDLFLFAGTLWLAARVYKHPERRREWLVLGVVMGALSLTRENALVLIGVVLLWSLFGIPKPAVAALAASDRQVSRRRAKDQGPHQAPRTILRAAFFLAGLALVLVPVAARNYAVGGGFYLTTSQFGPNFFIGNNPQSDGTYMSLRYGRGAPEYERQDATELAEHALGRSLTPAEVSSYWTDRALDFITSQPGAWLKLLGRKVVLLLNASEMLDTESQESYAQYSLVLRLLGWFGHFGVLVPLALLGMLLAWPEWRRLALLYAITITYAASVVMFYVFARYRLPLVPLFILFAAHAISVGWTALRTLAAGGNATAPAAIALRTFLLAPRTVVGGVIVLASVVVANWPLLSTRLMMAITETNLGTALQDRGRSAEALEHFQRALAIQPDYAPAYNNMGVTQRAGGAVDRAIDSYRHALALKGDYPDAHYNLANALLEQNRVEEATEHFNIALKSIPDSAGVRNNLGIALAAQGRHEDAVSSFERAVSVDPQSATAHRNLGDALIDAGRTAEGLAELRHAIQLAPDDPVAHYSLGVVLLQGGSLDEAAAEFRTTLRLNPQSFEAHNNLGIALGSQGKLDEAIDEFNRALAINPSFTDAQRNLQMATQARPTARQ
jgi:tetratricopeptide (TPR) repeat protein